MVIKKWENHSGELLDSINGYDVIDCKIRGFKHIIPIPTFKELNEIYKSQYYQNVKDFFDEKFNEDRDWYDLTFSDRYNSFKKY